jgi:hypothetical protein
MLHDGVKEPVDVSGDGVFGLLAGLPSDGPDQLRELLPDLLDRFPADLSYCLHLLIGFDALK